MEVLNHPGCLPFNVNRSIPTVIFDLIEGFKIPLHPLLKLTEVLTFILIRLGNAREAESDVLFLKSLLPPVQHLMDSLLFRSRTAKKDENGKQENGKERVHQMLN